MVHPVAGQPAFAMEAVGPLFHELKFAARAFCHKVAIEADEITVLNAAVGGVAGIAGCPATLEIVLTGNMARMGRETLVTHDAGAFVAAVAKRVVKAALRNIIACGVVFYQEPLVLRAMRPSRRIGIIAGVAVGALDD